MLKQLTKSDYAPFKISDIMVKNIIAYSLMLIILGCNQGSKIEKTITLFDKIEKNILEDSEFKVDRIEIISSNKFTEKIFYIKNRIIKKEFYSLDTSILFGRTWYSSDGKFELRNELSKSGAITTNGVVFEGKYYGPWEVNYDNGEEMYRGFRYKDINIGDENYFNEAGRIERTVLYGNEQFFDSIIIKFDSFSKEM